MVEPAQDDGAVRFTVRIDGQDDLLQLDTLTVDPNRIWEIEPSFVETFRASLQGGHADFESEGDADLDLETYRGETNTRLSHISTRISEIENANTDFRSATASTLRYIAADLLRLSHGESLEFANHYADRYDLAVDKQDTFRAATNAVGDNGNETVSRHTIQRNETAASPANQVNVVQSVCSDDDADR